MRELGAALVINGSYFARDGTPDTPIVSAGARLGPRHYIANHGAFVASPRSVGVRDFASLDWHIALRGAEDAMISYPLLVARDGSSRVKADARWLANRSFVAEDHDGRIILGTTAEAFFSLERLAGFLRAGAARSRGRAQSRRRPGRLPGHRAQRLSPQRLRPLGALGPRRPAGPADAGVRHGALEPADRAGGPAEVSRRCASC